MESLLAQCGLAQSKQFFEHISRAYRKTFLHQIDVAPHQNTELAIPGIVVVVLFVPLTTKTTKCIGVAVHIAC